MVALSIGTCALSMLHCLMKCVRYC